MAIFKANEHASDQSSILNCKIYLEKYNKAVERYNQQIYLADN